MLLNQNSFNIQGQNSFNLGTFSHVPDFGALLRHDSQRSLVRWPLHTTDAPALRVAVFASTFRVRGGPMAAGGVCVARGCPRANLACTPALVTLLGLSEIKLQQVGTGELAKQSSFGALLGEQAAGVSGNSGGAGGGSGDGDSGSGGRAGASGAAGIIDEVSGAGSGSASVAGQRSLCAQGSDSGALPDDGFCLVVTLHAQLERTGSASGQAQEAGGRAR